MDFYRSTVTFEAILEPVHVDKLIGMLMEAAKEAQRYEQ
jgi:hypothetical protein